MVKKHIMNTLKNKIESRVVVLRNEFVHERVYCTSVMIKMPKNSLTESMKPNARTNFYEKKFAIDQTTTF